MSDIGSRADFAAVAKIAITIIVPAAACQQRGERQMARVHASQHALTQALN
jgi:hypothetical protein